MEDARLQHARLAEALIHACGGVAAIVRDKKCRLASTRLYDCMDATTPAVLPIDVVWDLERSAGRPIYSQAGMERGSADTALIRLLDTACELTEDAAELQHEIRLDESKPHGISQRELERIEATAARIGSSVHAIVAEAEREARL